MEYYVKITTPFDMTAGAAKREAIEQRIKKALKGGEYQFEIIQAADMASQFRMQHVGSHERQIAKLIDETGEGMSEEEEHFSPSGGK